MAVELVVFDWDGTLVDSTGRIVECLHRAADDTRLPLLAPERYRSIIGLGLPEALLALYPDTDAATREFLRSRYAHHYIAAEDDPCRPYDGAVRLLDALRARGIRLAVATGKNRPGLTRAFRNTGLGDYFVSSRTADETRSKPHPLMLEELLAEQRIPAPAAVMIGDTSFDLEMARLAGVPSVGITHGAHDADELLRHAPLALADHLDEILDILEMAAARHHLANQSLAGSLP